MKQILLKFYFVWKVFFVHVSDKYKNSTFVFMFTIHCKEHMGSWRLIPKVEIVLDLVFLTAIAEGGP